MRLFCLLVGLVGGLLRAPAPVAAQQVPAASPAADTTQPADPRQFHPVARLGLQDGRVVPAFIVGLDLSAQGQGLAVTRQHPLLWPRTPILFVPTGQLRWLQLRGRYYEPIRRDGQAATGLVLRLQAGPRVELFDRPTFKSKAVLKREIKARNTPKVVLPEYFYWVPPFSDNFEHLYYLRRPGQALLVPVPEGRKFAAFLADYLADAPALAARIRRSESGYRYPDLPELLRQYNAQ